MDAEVEGLHAASSSSIIDKCRQLDKGLAAAFKSGDIRLLRRAWVLEAPEHLPYRQVLEEREGRVESPLLSPEEAAALLARGDRSIGALTHPWYSPGDPDPAGVKLKILREALLVLPHIEAIFVDYASLFQHPPNGKRTEAENEAFDRALGVMGDVYASAVGTTVLQIKEIPPRPQEFDGALCLFGLKAGVDEAAVRQALSGGDLSAEFESCDLAFESTYGVVRFATHAAALQAMTKDVFSELCGGVDTRYNERSYDGRSDGEGGRDGDEGRGWCCFEGGVSGELLVRLSVYPRMKAELDKLPPKLISLASGRAPEPVELSHSDVWQRMQQVTESIQQATFTGKGDKEKVPTMYKSYVERVATALTSTLALQTTLETAETATEMPPMPLVDAPPANALRLADGQLLLLPDADVRLAGGDGEWLAKVEASERAVRNLFRDGVAELTFDGHSHAVIPWRPFAVGAEASLCRDFPMLRALGERVQSLWQSLRDEASHPPSEAQLRDLKPPTAMAWKAKQLRDLGKASVDVVADAAKLPVVEEDARQVGDAIRRVLEQDAAASVPQANARIQSLHESLELLSKALKVLAVAGLAHTLRRDLRLGERVQSLLDGEVVILVEKGGGLDGAGAEAKLRSALGEFDNTRFEEGRWWHVRFPTHAAAEEAVETATAAGALPGAIAVFEASNPPSEARLEELGIVVAAWKAKQLRDLGKSEEDALQAGDTIVQALEQLVMAWKAKQFRELEFLADVVVATVARKAGDAIRQVLKKDADYPPGEVAPPLGERIESLRESLERLSPEALNALAVPAWREGWMVGARRFASGQRLVVRAADGAWRESAAEEACTLDGGPASLHPWNHAPLEVPLDMFEAVRAWHITALRAQHSHIADALSGRRLDALEQCVAIEVAGGGAELASVVDARSLAAWLRTLHQERLAGGEATRPPATLLTAGPASGKTTMLSQVVVLSLDSELVPILIKAQLLQQRLISSPAAFATAWNWVDAYLRLEHSETSPLYRMLRQAMMARRALILFDGLDEGGTNREQIERHVTEVLAPQGHVLLATSRPAGIDEDRFATFHRLRLSPLTPEQQEQALVQRVGDGRSAPLLDYVRERVPIDMETGLRVTANPLMLSMFASVFELRTGLPMPSTVAELYKVASDVMLSRSGAASRELRRLLQAIFFEAQVSQMRVIEDRRLDEAALGLERPEALKAIRELARRHGWKDGRGGEARVWRESSGGWTGIEAACAADMRSACGSLPAAMRDTLAEVRRRVARDELPLLSLLQAEPLQLQSSHLSFQEYFAACALCEEGTLSGAPPWKWQASWANTLALGKEMGEPFAKGLKRAAGVGDSLNLCGQLGGDRPTALRAVMLLSGVLKTLDISTNDIGPKGGVEIAEALRGNAMLTSLDVGLNGLTEEAALGIVRVERQRNKLTSLGLAGVGIGPTGAAEIAEYVSGSGVLQTLNLDGLQLDLPKLRGTDPAATVNLSSKNLGPASAIVIASLIAGNAVLKELDLSRNQIGPKGGVAIGEALAVNKVLTDLNLWDNGISDEGAKAIGEALAVNEVLKKLNIRYNKIGSEGAAAIAEALRGNVVLTSLDVYQLSLYQDAYQLQRSVASGRLSGTLRKAEGALLADELPCAMEQRRRSTHQEPLWEVGPFLPQPISWADIGLATYSIHSRNGGHYTVDLACKALAGLVVHHFPDEDGLDGRLSPRSKVTLDDEAKQAAGIPADAATFAFAYPLVGSPQCPSPLSFLSFGGFVYWDERHRVCGVNALEEGSGLYFDGPRQLPSPRLRGLLYDSSRVSRVRRPPLLDPPGHSSRGV